VPEHEVVIIGGGLVGLSTAYALATRFSGIRVRLVEKEPEVGSHQSSHNSGVLHAGLYYRAGSAKARLAVAGIRKMVRFCKEHAIPHEICGKLVVAVDEREVPRLQTLYKRGQTNGLQGVAWLSPAAAGEIEPHVRCVAAVRVPEEGIVSFPAVIKELVAELLTKGVEIATGSPVRGIDRVDGSWRVHAGDHEITADFLVNCAGLYADRIAALAGEPLRCRIIPFRGEYYTLRPERAHLVRHLIYPVPDPALPFLGAHLTRMIDGRVAAGPNAVLALAREGYRKSDVNFGDLVDALCWPGLWRFALRYHRATFSELKQSFSKSAFAKTLQRLVPELEEGDLVQGPAGVRAQAMGPDGRLIDDFALLQRNKAIHVLNAPSPAATASLAIGEEIAASILSRLEGHGGRMIDSPAFTGPRV
jgi:L-2-hydroxyglutarate oxidase